MGKSAKLHKRIPKKLKSPNVASSSTPAIQTKQAQVQAAKKKTSLKEKAVKSSGSSKGDLLRGADYVEMLLGGRRKARVEAEKLLQSPK